MSRASATTDRERALLAQGYRRIVGLDEVGRGCLAGPVVAAAVLFPTDLLAAPDPLPGVADSKLLAPDQRLALAEEILARVVAVGLGQATAAEIDCWGLGVASRWAMVRALRALPVPPDYLLVDYFTLPDCPCPQEGVVDGDARCFTIAAASIVAKVVRDRLCSLLDALYPGYGFAIHKGYGTPEHRAALARLGPSPVHRRSFAPVRALLAPGTGAVRRAGDG
jgi:ribonuclease HII